nr:hypothetical protein [Tanacetum cinerariifolium]
VTSFISATPEREDKSHADSVTGLNLRSIGASQRFVISLDYSHHSGANIVEAEVDSIVRSSAPAIATVATVTAAVDVDTTADRVHVLPYLFGVGSSSTGRIDSVPGGFSDVPGSDFFIGGIRTVVDPDSDLQKVYGASGDGQGTDIQPVVATTDTIVEDMAPLQPRRQRKRKIVVADASGPSHPPKNLREHYGALGGASTSGKSMPAVQSLFTGAVLNADARGEPIPTLPFVTSFISATPEREDKSHADSVTGLNLRISRSSLTQVGIVVVNYVGAICLRLGARI